VNKHSLSRDTDASLHHYRSSLNKVTQSFYKTNRQTGGWISLARIVQTIFKKTK
jgi:hypothetical protein